jgi:flagellar biosynthetic protein FliQ
VTPQTIIDLGRETLWITILVGAPGLLAALAVGLLVSLVQAVTQIQEATLAFVPKALAVGLAVLLTLPFTVGALQGFGERLFLRVAGTVGP